MATVTRLFGLVVSLVLLGLPPVGTADEAPVPGAAIFYGLTGDWQGEGSTSENGRQTTFDLQLDCDKASEGWAVLCTMTGRPREGEMLLAETDLFGVDPVTGQAHWYAVTNSGETHDHLVSWSDPRTMHAHIQWQQEGRQMEERIEFRLTGDTLRFHSVTSEDGHDTSEFAGTLQHNF